jgi:hypothetical protein
LPLIDPFNSGNICFEGSTGQFITPWMSIAEQARREVAATHAAADAEARAAACERAAMRVSLANLETFPFVREAVAAGRRPPAACNCMAGISISTAASCTATTRQAGALNCLGAKEVLLFKA